MTDQPSPHVSGTISAVADSLDHWADMLRDGRRIRPSICGLRDMAKVVRLAAIQPDPQPVDDSEAHAHERQQGLLSEGADPQPVASEPEGRWETDIEHLARDIREGRFPSCSDRQWIAAPASVAEAARAVIQTEGVEWTASAMIQHIAYVLRAKGKAVLTSNAGDFGRQVLDFDAALRAIAEEGA